MIKNKERGTNDIQGVERLYSLMPPHKGGGTGSKGGIGNKGGSVGNKGGRRK